MDFDLVVVSPVAGYEIGARITDRGLIAEILADERESHVRKVAALPAEAAPVEVAPAPGTVASIPFMITKAMKARLRDLGKTDAEIAALTPAEAHALLDA